MANVVVLGAQWGDEGKAKIIDMLASKADVVVRCQGGCNAGHTVAYQGEVFKFHLVPSGLLYENKLCVVGNGTVIDPAVLMGEIETLHQKGYSTANLKVSNRAHLSLPYHTELDGAQETLLEGHKQGKIGTTKRGIGPTYADKVSRSGLRVGDLYETPDVLRQKLEQLVAMKNPVLEKVYQLPAASVDALMEFCQTYAEKLRPYVSDTVPLLYNATQSGKTILFEGAQGTLLDIDFGTYPFVTSSNSTAGGACTGSGIGPTKIDRVIGVMKAYTTRVGSGPFPTELEEEVGKHLLNVGNEYGTTTGRPRRCGWFDAVIGKYSVMVNGLDGIALTKLDVMDGLKEVKICVGYRHKQTGEILESFPAQLSTLDAMEPVYETMPGWQGPIDAIRDYNDLPQTARNYIERLSVLMDCPVTIVSLGPDREQTIVLQDPTAGEGRTIADEPAMACGVVEHTLPLA